MKNSVKNSIFIILMIVLCLSMLFFSLLSPYETWDPTVVNHDMADALKFIWIAELVISAVCAFFTRPYNKKLFIVFIILCAVSLMMLIRSLLLG